MDQISFDDLFTDDSVENIKTPVLSPLHHEIMALLKSGETYALEKLDTWV